MGYKRIKIRYNKKYYVREEETVRKASSKGSELNQYIDVINERFEKKWYQFNRKTYSS